MSLDRISIDAVIAMKKMQARSSQVSESAYSNALMAAGMASCVCWIIALQVFMFSLLDSANLTPLATI